MRKTRILLHPDLFHTGNSGAIVAREAARQLTLLGYEVGVFTHDPPGAEASPYPFFSRKAYRGKANYAPGPYRSSFLKALAEFRPDSLFFIGTIINIPVVYHDLCRENGIHTAFLLLVQDFFCARLHAALGSGPCTRCLTGLGLHAFLHRCADKQPRPLPYLLNYQVVRQMVVPRLKRIDHVMGSSDEQLGYYRQVGVSADRLRKIPLFFDQSRIKPTEGRNEGYFVIIGQNRHEKGIHLVRRIMEKLRKEIRVKMMFFDDRETEEFLRDHPGNKPYVESGQLEVLPGVTMTNGGPELIARSSGVINPSIWATTTEYVLLETLGYSKPVIAFGVGIHREVLLHRENGLCVPAGDFAGMAAEIHYLADHPEKVERIGNAARSLYHRLTDASAFSGTLVEVFGPPGR